MSDKKDQYRRLMKIAPKLAGAKPDTIMKWIKAFTKLFS